MNEIKLLQSVFMILCGIGVPVVVIGVILDDITYWALADTYFIAIFASSAAVFYFSRKEK